MPALRLHKQHQADRPVRAVVFLLCQAPALRLGLQAMLRRFVFILVLLAPAGAALADEFVAGTEDLPLMPGLAAVAGSSLVFDKPQGRIVEAQAAGKVSRSAVQSFYGTTLSQVSDRQIRHCPPLVTLTVLQC